MLMCMKEDFCCENIVSVIFLGGTLWGNFLPQTFQTKIYFLSVSLDKTSCEYENGPQKSLNITLDYSNFQCCSKQTCIALRPPARIMLHVQLHRSHLRPKFSRSMPPDPPIENASSIDAWKLPDVVSEHQNIFAQGSNPPIHLTATQPGTFFNFSHYTAIHP